ncbi:hypothetical protein COCOBI_18-1480 [Coccomyxa sp. Obi]|nr:hypothetical protein COCOBI_18-1480 [Coccomyxa sp. Obi]
MQTAVYRLDFEVTFTGPAQLPAGTPPDNFTPANDIPDALGVYNCAYSRFAEYNGSQLAQQMPCARDGNKYIVCVKGVVPGATGACQLYSKGEFPPPYCEFQCYTVT